MVWKMIQLIHLLFVGLFWRKFSGAKILLLVFIEGTTQPKVEQSGPLRNGAFETILSNFWDGTPF